MSQILATEGRAGDNYWVEVASGKTADSAHISVHFNKNQEKWPGIRSVLPSPSVGEALAIIQLAIQDRLEGKKLQISYKDNIVTYSYDVPLSDNTPEQLASDAIGVVHIAIEGAIDRAEMGAGKRRR